MTGSGLVFLIAVVLPGLQEENPSPVQIQPRAELKFVYDDNIYLVDEDLAKPKWDFIFLGTAAVSASAEEKNLRASASYGVTRWVYGRTADASHTEHSGVLDTEILLTDRVVARGGMSYDKMATPVDIAGTTIIEMAHTKFYQTLSYMWPDGKDGGEFRGELLRVATSAGDFRFIEHESLLLGLSAFHRYAPNLLARGKADIGRTSYEKSLKNSNNFYTVGVGGEYTLEIGLRLSANLAYHGRIYEEESGSATFKDHYRGAVYDVRLESTAKEGGQLSVSVMRDAQESHLSNSYVVQTMQIAYQHSAAEDWTVTVAPKFSFFREGNKDAIQKAREHRSLQVTALYDAEEDASLELTLLYRWKTTNDNEGEYSNWRLIFGWVQEF